MDLKITDLFRTLVEESAVVQLSLSGCGGEVLLFALLAHATGDLMVSIFRLAPWKPPETGRCSAQAPTLPPLRFPIPLS